MEIQRDLIRELIQWKTSPDRKPLILKGVRQCGKTWLLQKFGKTHPTSTLKNRIPWPRCLPVPLHPAPFLCS
jgi:predicted AAA+ superfamily ATPase